MKKAYRKRLTKLENHNLKQRFKLDFSTGKYELPELAKKYTVGQPKLHVWKKQLFGKGSIKQQVAYKMHKAGLPTFVIADYLNTLPAAIHRHIKNYKIAEGKRTAAG